MGMGNAGGAGLGNLGLLEVPHTQTLDLGPGDQPPLLDPAHLDLEGLERQMLQLIFKNLDYFAASTLSRSFQRPNSRRTSIGQEEVLVQIEDPLPPTEESKLSEVSNFFLNTFEVNLQVRLLMPPPVEGGQQQPLTITPAHSRARRADSRRKVRDYSSPASLSSFSLVCQINRNFSFGS